MPLAPGSRIGVYEIIAPIGRGGMGEVYRARDVRLQRDVAIKSLPEEFQTDPERLARFEREARLLAALNHTNIAAIHGLEERDGARFLVMELVDGDTLAERLAAGPLPVEDALEIAAQIARGLEAAHATGIVHRDLKPSNVKIRPGGGVKVLDLGLARSMESSRPVDSSLSPTITTPATRDGVILGTAAYMSPEQARGKPVDGRSDVFSFGCVLYECLTGRQAFGGETVSDTLSAILRAEPDWSALPAETPQRVRDLLARCLRKDPARRVHHIADARIEIEDARDEEPASAAGTPAAVRPPAISRFAWALGGLFVGVAITAGLLHLRSPAAAPSPAVIRAEIPLPRGARLWAEKPPLAISPDGRMVVFSAVQDGVPRLFRRGVGSAAAEPIDGTEQGTRPFFSPDGQWVGFVTRDEMRKVPLSGGTPLFLTQVSPLMSGAAWGEDGRIYFSRTANTGLLAVSEKGGAWSAATRLDTASGERAHVHPQVLPGGRSILYAVRVGRDFTDATKSNVAVWELSSGRQRTVLEGASFARYGGGRLFFVRGTRVYSVAFDLARLAVTGAPTDLAGDITTAPTNGLALFDVAADGTLVYVEGPPIADPVTAVVRRDARGAESVIALPPGNYFSPRLSPDGKRLALLQFEGARGFIVIFDRERSVLSKLTPEPGRFLAPVWSPAGDRMAFCRVLEHRPELCIKNIDGTAAIQEMPRATGEDAEFPSSWSSDGRTILMTITYSADRTAERRLLSQDVWLASADGKEKPKPWLETPFRETGATISPDGKWVAYVSDESGAPQVYVRPLEGAGPKIQVSTEPASEPAWTRGGREIVYRTGERRQSFVAVDVRTDAGFSVSAPRILFRADWEFGTLNHEFREWDVSPDGDEWIGLRAARSGEPDRRIALVTGWGGQ
jgi:Tol biopolymer transport system component